MPRQTGRHKLIEDDGISSDSDEDSADNGAAFLDGDEAAEYALNDPYNSKKRKRKTKQRTKEEALYGDFLPPANDADFRAPKRANHLKTPNFVPSASTLKDGNFDDVAKVDNLSFDVNAEAPQAVNGSDIDQNAEKAGASSESDLGSESGSGEDMDDDDSSEEEKANVPVAREEVVEDLPERPSFGGLGSYPSQSNLSQGAASGMAGPGNSRQGIGSTQSDAQLPSAFGNIGRRPQRAFLGASNSNANSPSSTPKPAVQLSAQEKKHFAQLENAGGIGFKLLAKMGWAAGSGLGAGGEGRINPVESQKRPQGMGIGHGGFKEQTKASQLERRRREGKVEGQSGSDQDDDDLTPAARKRRQQHRAKQKALKEGKQENPDRTQAWTKASPQKRKAKVEHRTYEELVGGNTEGDVDSTLGQIIDLTGSELPSLASTLSLAVPVPSSDTTRLPELRHNLKLIADTKQAELNAHIKEGKSVMEKRKWVEGQQVKAERAAAAEAEHIHRLKQVMRLSDELAQLSKRASSQRLPPSEAFETMSKQFDILMTSHASDMVPFQLDQLVVAAVAPVLRIAWSSWEPLDQPELCASDLKHWRKALAPTSTNASKATNGVNGHTESNGYANGAFLPSKMSAFDALIWTYWLPRVRSAINNSWDANDAAPAIALFAAWEKILPPFIRDNILDQLILPKVSKAMAEWSPKTGNAPLHTIVFPWLPFAGIRMDNILEEAKRKLKSWLKSWRARDGVPEGFAIWKEVYSSREWDDLMIRLILPALGSMLREKFQINPRDQSLSHLEAALTWRPYLRSAMMDQLLSTEFFPKWLDALYVWLTASPDYNQVSQWYSWWKGWFKDDVASLPGVKAGFARGLNLMNQALVLGDDAPYRLERPSLDLPPSQSQDIPTKTSKPKRMEETHAEVTFRSIVEEMAAENNLIFMAAGRSHDQSGQALYRVSTNINGKNGITVYLHDDIVWAQEGQGWAPIGVQEMIDRAKKN